ncbi:hypothetical protein GGR51DRAFT_150115 [Nemania sp. FL0031]|nr:hypothetical protein GGR51DRAFT_150115 [Nemania sp. FL0031]
MPDSHGAGDPKLGSARPSFTGYWKRSKDQQASQSLTFVSSKLGQPAAPGENGAQREPSAEAKAKERRQQVRKAQRQHRQRKANYTKQLEMDVTKLRDDIARVEQEITSLRSQNGAMRTRLAAPPTVITTADDTAVTLPPPPPQQQVDFSGDMAFSTDPAPDYTVFLDLPDFAGTPTYQVRRASPEFPDWSGGSSRAASSYAPETLSSVTPTSTLNIGFDELAAMETFLSEEQTDQAINFILALEHCCWSHIDASCFEHHAHPPPSKMDCPLLPGTRTGTAANTNTSDEADDDSKLNGHALSATALALQSAPLSIFTRLNDLQERLAPSAAAPLLPPPLSPQAAAPIEWSSKALTLSNLRHLAGSLNPSDTELAPVQAWFELASLYGVGVATDAAVLARLRGELVGEMRCVTFGAAVDRDLFEGILERVMGFLPRSWRDEMRVDGGDEYVAGVGGGVGGIGVEVGHHQGNGGKTKSGPGVFERLINTARGGGSRRD